MKVLAALSGGVDSSVAAALLLDQGHEVVAATMKLWGGTSDTGCCSVGDVEDARRSAAQLGIDHHVFNYTDEFAAHVVGPYVADHAAGRTPNPCVECNRHLKFDVLLQRAELLGFDAVATGHHARLVCDGVGVRRIARGADAAKDQSYVLYPLRGFELERVLFPIGHLRKEEVRARAAALGLRTAVKPDSQDVCFVTRAAGRRAFLGERMELHPAEVHDRSGALVGHVDAVELLTIGQRKGLGLAGGDAPRYVTSVEVAERRVTVGSRDDLLCSEVVLEQVVWSQTPMEGELLAQCSAHGRPSPATVTTMAARESIVIGWAAPHSRIAPGQSIVLYEGDTVVGGGLVAVA